MDEKNIPASDIERSKQLAAISYLWIFSFIILLARRDSPFVQLHARQGLILFVLSIVLWPWEITRYAEILILALMVLGFIQAALGRVYRIPVIGDIAEGKFTWGHVRKGWHIAKHTAIRLVKPEHVTPVFREEAKRQHEQEMQQKQGTFSAEEKLVEREEKKLSSLFHRVEEDEKKLHELEEEVHGLKTSR
ncbi:MAG: hypothetical protein V1760_03845 [Candidatus Peregrinibacteria bacterium]